MADQYWTASMVEERLEEAADVLKRLPEKKVQGYFNAWPPIVREFWDAYGRDEARLHRPPPAPAAIDRMDESLDWLRLLPADDARLLWERAEGTPWKTICRRFGLSRNAAWRHWVGSLQLISIFLNGKPVRRWSRLALVKMWRAANGRSGRQPMTEKANEVKTMQSF